MTKNEIKKINWTLGNGMDVTIALTHDAGAVATIETNNQLVTILNERTPVRKEIEEETHGFEWCDNCQSYCFGDCGE